MLQSTLLGCQVTSHVAQTVLILLTMAGLISDRHLT